MESAQTLALHSTLNGGACLTLRVAASFDASLLLSSFDDFLYLLLLTSALSFIHHLSSFASVCCTFSSCPSLFSCAGVGTLSTHSALLLSSPSLIRELLFDRVLATIIRVRKQHTFSDESTGHSFLPPAVKSRSNYAFQRLPSHLRLHGILCAGRTPHSTRHLHQRLLPRGIQWPPQTIWA